MTSATSLNTANIKYSGGKRSPNPITSITDLAGESVRALLNKSSLDNRSLQAIIKMFSK